MENSSLLPSVSVAVANFLCAAAIFCTTLILLKKSAKKLLSPIILVAVALSAVSFGNIKKIAAEYSQMENPAKISQFTPIIHLSKTEKNVLFIMLDRAFMPFVQDIFKKKPELKKSFSGFELYPNTVSFAQYTMLGTPGLFGGYSFTPREINKRTDKTLREKHNEALLSLPVLFSQNGFESTIIDMPYENFLKNPTDSMYKDFPKIRHLHAKGLYSDVWYERNSMTPSTYTSTMIKHNLFMLGIFKATPPILRKIVYRHEWWYATEVDSDYRKKAFIDNYAVLDFLPELTDFSARHGTYTAIDNEITHEPVFLQFPEYTPAETVSDRGNSRWKNEKQYHIQAAAFRKLAEFFDYLKSNNVYDNTRIIIVSDHGTDIETGLFDNTNFPFKKENLAACLMFKDFYAKNADSGSALLPEYADFMTNADAPALATNDILPNAKNPFTNIPLSVSDKEKYIWLTHAPSMNTRIANEKTYDISEWYYVSENIFKAGNWKRRGE